MEISSARFGSEGVLHSPGSKTEEWIASPRQMVGPIIAGDVVFPPLCPDPNGLPMEDPMIENKIESTLKPLPLPYEEFETFPKHVEEFFDLIARRPFELLEKRPLLFGREFEQLWKNEAELVRTVYLKLYETEENLVVRAEVPGFTERELNVSCEPWRLTITGKKESRETSKVEKKEEMAHVDKMQIYKTIKFPMEVKPDNVRAILKNGVLELTLPKAAVVKKVKVEVKTF